MDFTTCAVIMMIISRKKKQCSGQGLWSHLQGHNQICSYWNAYLHTSKKLHIYYIYVWWKGSSIIESVLLLTFLQICPSLKETCSPYLCQHLINKSLLLNTQPIKLLKTQCSSAMLFDVIKLSSGILWKWHFRAFKTNFLWVCKHGPKPCCSSSLINFLFGVYIVGKICSQVKPVIKLGKICSQPSSKQLPVST